MKKNNNIDLSGLKRFGKSLKQISSNNGEDNKNQKLSKFGVLAYFILSESYAGTRFKVEKPQKVSESSIELFVRGDGIAFDEFGTGIYAKGSYKGNLPTQTISFESAGYQQSTKGWDYYYDWQGPEEKNPKRIVNGRLGWFTGKDKIIFSEGHAASNRFYNACKIIKEEIKNND